ncbi:MAG: hypothetical protein HYV08_18090 [Deltaproteobacteria bacterium]|nr:hypothetical protein [Deltaproteobacteria bacterium]MBI3079690.1 hypothetical protein [Deltaproteobacteria bacterium]
MASLREGRRHHARAGAHRALRQCGRGRIQGLSQDPRPRGVETLSRQERYRVRQGDSRIAYAGDDERRTVEIVKIGHRREVYRSL